MITRKGKWFRGSPFIVNLSLAAFFICTFLSGCWIIRGQQSSSQAQDSTNEDPTTQSTTLPDLIDETSQPNELSTTQITTTFTSETSTDVPGSESPTREETTTTRKPVECPNQGYCLNGGTCVLDERGNMICICPEGFYGARCQTKNICKTVIANNLTGDQICSRIGRDCWKNDKFFRCNCLEDEFFIFKTTDQLETQTKSISESRSLNERANKAHDSRQKLQRSMSEIVGKSNQRLTKEEYLSLAERYAKSLTNSSHPIANGGKITPTDDGQSSKDSAQQEVWEQPYIAECRKMDKCLGVRCKQLSERCRQGHCVCNKELGYTRDPRDNECKLLDPCQLPTEDGKPICGQAECVATYDKELYKCICPIGYQALRVGEHRNSTVCTILRNLICSVPLLNKCQHICNVDSPNNNYKCSCLRGYKPGSRSGIDDHMCFFIEQVDELDQFLASGSRNDQFVYRAYPNQRSSTTYQPTQPPRNLRDTFTYDPFTSSTSSKLAQTTATDPISDSLSLDDFNAEDLPTRLKSEEIIIRREVREGGGSSRSQQASSSSLNNTNSQAAAIHRKDDTQDTAFNRMSAQERCNMFCDENKICELEQGSTDSYRCVCDRQGYVSVGDRCLDWCAAADFDSHRRSLLEYTCWSGICKASQSRLKETNWNKQSQPETQDPQLIEQDSSWRPTFECDCRNSPLLIQDPETKLCKFNFRAAIEPCLPGNVGYIECVEHKNAYCAVLYRQHKQFISDHQRDRIYKASLANSDVNNQTNNSNKKTANMKKPLPNKLYTCVCSPERKFLVDKPRNKERCVDECDLLNVECGRFNRMCRSSTMEIEDFGHRNLLHLGLDGPRIDFKRTGCECLPGFNVGPSESLDFTVDDNVPNSSSNPNVITDLIDSSYTVLNIDDPIPITYIKDGSHVVDQESSSQFRARYMNINSRCLLDYDVVEFHASFKAPAEFNPSWVDIKNAQISSPKREIHLINRQTNTVHNIKQEVLKIGPQHTWKQAKPTTDYENEDSISLDIPDFMGVDIADLNKHVVLVGLCDPSLMPISIEAYRECSRYRYWIVQKLRHHYIDWRRVMTEHLKQTFDLMDGNIRLRINKCEASLKSVKRPQRATNNDTSNAGSYNKEEADIIHLDPFDQEVVVDADIHCELTLHSASDDSLPRYARKVLLEKQLQRFIFAKPNNNLIGKDYYLMAPNMLIDRDSFDHLASHRKEFNPCKSNYPYCEKQTRCDMVDTVNFTCTCEYGYTPIGSRDIYYADSRKEVCEDINECLFDVCKELANVSTCINEIGDYRCQCNRHYIGDNKRYCKHVCNTISCKHGKCRLVDDHHAFCECDEGYKETDCSVQDPSVALRKANMIICGSIFASVLLLAITFAISLNSQLKKTKRKLKQIEAANDSGRLFEFSNQQPFRQRLSKVSMTNN